MNEEHVREKINSEEVKRVVEDNFEQKLNMAKIEELIKNNYIEFEHKTDLYRVCLLNMRDKEELEMLRAKRYSILCKDKEILTEAEWIKLYKERGIVDINEIKLKIESLGNEIKALNLKLGEIISLKSEENVAKKYVEEIQTLMIERQTLIVQKSDYLYCSLQNMLLNYVAAVITYLSLQKNIDGEWKRAYNSFDIFTEEPDTELIEQATAYAFALQHIL